MVRRSPRRRPDRSDRSDRPDRPDRPDRRPWRAAHGEAIVESAVTNRATAWERHAPAGGVVLELGFADERRWHAWHALPGVPAALDAVPDSVAGLLVYRAAGVPGPRRLLRRPRPVPPPTRARHGGGWSAGKRAPPQA